MAGVLDHTQELFAPGGSQGGRKTPARADNASKSEFLFSHKLKDCVVKSVVCECLGP
jgi:hypothetical protein